MNDTIEASSLDKKTTQGLQPTLSVIVFVLSRVDNTLPQG